MLDDGLIYKYNVAIVKKYLNEEELNRLKDLTNLFLSTWGYLNNENFNSIEFDGFKNESGIDANNAIGIISK